MLRHLLASRSIGACVAALSSGVGLACALGVLASAACVFLCPAASFSGVPEIMSCLNGVDMRASLEARTGAIKFLSNVLAVSSGLPIGPEGPMLHIGAVIGNTISRLVRSGRGTAMRSEREERDFTTAGVGCGVAVAFGAPLGGLLFAFEEVSSGIATSISGYGNTLVLMVFFCCLCGVFAAGLLKSGEDFITGSGKGFGAFNNEWSVAFEVTKLVNNHIYVVLIGAGIGGICGSLGALFSVVVVRFTQFKRRLLTSRRSKLIDVAIVLLLFTTVSVLLSTTTPCTHADCFVNADGEYSCAPKGGAGGGGGGGGAQGVSVPHHAVTESVVTSLCTSAGGNNGKIAYSEFGTLMLSSGHSAVSHLLSRETPLQFSYITLLTFLVIYFLFSCIAATTHLASGIFVPMLVIGSCVGRTVGLVVVDLFKSFDVVSAARAVIDDITGADMGSASNSDFKWEWIDPGIFALIGCGAFMGGVTRLTVSIAVITMEITDEVRFLLPIMTAIMVAKWVADSLMPTPLYHALISLKEVPFLELKPDVEKILDLYDARELLGRDRTVLAHEDLTADDGALSANSFSGVICVREMEEVGNIRSVLTCTAHNAFPVVRKSPVAIQADGSAAYTYAGMLSRAHLRRILEHQLAMMQDGSGNGINHAGVAGEADHGRSLTYEDLEERSERANSHDMAHASSSLVENGHNRLGYGRLLDSQRIRRWSGTPAAQMSTSGDIAMAEMGVDAPPLRNGNGGTTSSSSLRSSINTHRATTNSRHSHNNAVDSLCIDLRDYVDTAAITVYDKTPVGRCYDMFVVLGLRHLVIVNETNAVVGIVTRKDLMPDRVEEVLELDAKGYDDLEL